MEVLPYTFGLCKEEGAASEAPEPLPSSVLPVPPSPALPWAQKGQRTCSATLPMPPSQNHPKRCGTSQGGETWADKEELGAKSPLCISSCLCSSQRMLCSHNPLARLPDPHGPTQKGFQIQPPAPCDDESSSHPSHGSDRHFTVSLQD